MTEPLTNPEYNEWKARINVIADMHANPDINDPYNDIKVNLGTELRLFVTIDALRNQLEGKKQAFEALQKAHASLVDQFQKAQKEISLLKADYNNLVNKYNELGAAWHESEAQLEDVDDVRILIPHSFPNKPIYYPSKPECHENCQRCSLDKIFIEPQ